jgi:YVTN family beta-propeller protein
VPVGASPHHPLFTPLGDLGLVVSQGPGELELLDPGRESLSGTVRVGTFPHWIALAPDGMTAYVTNEGSNDLTVVDLMTRAVTATIPVGNAPRKIVVVPGTAAPAAPAPQPAPATPPATAAGTAAGDGQSVRISGFAFTPASLTVAPGQTVTWTNADSVPHTVTADGGAWDSGRLPPGASFSFTPARPGTYAYHCAIHPFMRAVVEAG